MTDRSGSKNVAKKQKKRTKVINERDNKQKSQLKRKKKLKVMVFRT